ncbi:MAG TPA: hypothetical protein VHQ43_08850 [Solirubrobacterales bacterium]|jgi:uncharacterized cupredoxin-like copper-binding protein|nr:hypothetical protein [Solirubrobacterales bacterium]
MARKLKALGVACFALLAMGAIGASAASAHTFDVEVDHTILSAEVTPTFKEGKQIFTTATGEVVCKKISLSSASPENTILVAEGKTTGIEAVTAQPTYSECTATIPELGTVKETYEFTTCYYEFTGKTDANEHAEVHVKCTTKGDEIHVKVTAANLKCYTIPEQTLGGIHYTDTPNSGGATRDIDVLATIESLETTKEGACGSGVEKNGTYSGEVTVKGTDTEGKQKGILTTP